MSIWIVEKYKFCGFIWFCAGVLFEYVACNVDRVQEFS